MRYGPSPSDDEIKYWSRNEAKIKKEPAGCSWKRNYDVWVDMLRTLVPAGRTHRLSVVVAGMLQYTFELAKQTNNRNEDDHSTAMSIINPAETGNPDDIKGLIHDIVDRLFMDAGVEYERVSKRGEHYSITDEIYNEFASWYDYPWD